MSSDVISEGPPVVVVSVDDKHTVECPYCGQQVKLFLTTWEGMWKLVTRPHSVIVRQKIMHKETAARIGECTHHVVVKEGLVR